MKKINNFLGTDFIFYTKFTNNSINLLKKDVYDVYFLSTVKNLNDLYWYRIDNTIVVMKTSEVNSFSVNKLDQIEGMKFANIDINKNIIPFNEINSLPVEPDIIVVNNTFHIMLSKSSVGGKSAQTQNMLSNFAKNIPQNWRRIAISN